MRGAEHFDVIIEQLPWHLRNKVLDRLDDDGEFREEQPSRRECIKSYNKALRLLWWLLIIPVYAWAALFGLLGVLFIVVPVIGVPLMTIGGLPGAAHLGWRIRMGIPADRPSD